jgi:hypothetical protein
MEAWFDGCWATDAKERIHAVLQSHPHLKNQPHIEGRRISCFYSDEALALAAREAVEPLGFDVLLSDNLYFDVLPRGVQKGPTLLRTLQALNLSPERTLVAGDTLNDLSLFQTGLAGVAVANREPSTTVNLTKRSLKTASWCCVSRAARMASSRRSRAFSARSTKPFGSLGKKPRLAKKVNSSAASP